VTIIPVSSSWVVECGDVRPLGTKTHKLGDMSPRRIEIRRRIAEYGSVRAPREQAKVEKRRGNR